MGIISAILLGIILFIDIPVVKKPIKANLKQIYYKVTKALFIISAILHIYYRLTPNQGFDSSVISGLLLFGLTIIYTSAGEHTGIEDKVARKSFKILAWISIIILFIVHLLF